MIKLEKVESVYISDDVTLEAIIAKFFKIFIHIEENETYIDVYPNKASQLELDKSVNMPYTMRIRVK